MLSLSINLHSQEAEKKVQLSEFLITLEKEHGYKFNYIQSTIENIEIDTPEPNLSFNQIIEYLRQETLLTFRFLENKFVSIRKQNSNILLCGYLKDKDTQGVLPFATIQGKKETTITNEEGYFQLELSSRDEIITIRFLGYKTITRAVEHFNLQDCHTVYLVPQVEALGQVILANYLVEGITKLNTGELEVEFSKFNILPGLIETDVLQSVQAFPGIQSINETISNINIRGGSHDQNLILWDDIKMYQTGHFFGLISVFNPQMTEKVNVKKNGTNSDYSDGVSGTIAMQTNEAINSKFKASMGVNLIDVNGFADIPIGKKSSLQIGARKSLSDFTNTPTYDIYFDRIAQDTEVENSEDFVFNSNQQFDFYDTSLRWLYTPSDKDMLRVNFININNELLFNENAEVISGENTSRESSVTQNSLGAGLFYQRKWNDKLTSSLQIYETDYKLEAVNANLFASQRFLQENKVSETGAKLKFDYALSNTLLIHGGYQFIESKITNLDDVDNPVIRTLISEVLRTHSGFAQIDFQSRDQASNLNLGFRYNFLDKFKKHLYEPRISFHQRFLENFGVEISGEIKHQTTSQIVNFQNDFLGVEKRRWQLANDSDIPVIVSQQGAIALNFSNRSWLFSAEGYYKNVDGITTQSQGFQNQYEFIKTNGGYEVLGMDFLLRKRFKNINIWMSYSYMDNIYTFDNLSEVTFPSNFDITHALTIGLTYKYRSLKFSSGLNWHSGKPTTTPLIGQEIIDNVINYDFSNSSRLNEYLRVDASVLNEFKLGNTEIHVGASVWNILDKENQINNYFRINDEGEVEEFTQKALGLTPNATLRVIF